MSQTIKSVIVAGASGNIGKPIVAALRASKAFKVSVLLRPESTATFPEDVTVKRASFEDLAGLTEALRGQDAVVATVGSLQIPLQSKLIDAAADAGVKRYLSSEFGSNTAFGQTLEIVPFLQSKVDVVKQLKTKEKEGLSWTAIITGTFLQFIVGSPFFGVDKAKRTIDIYDPESLGTWSTTTFDQVGRAVVAVLQKPEQTENRYVFASSFTTTLPELQKSLERVSGEAWTANPVSSEKLEADSHVQMKAGNHLGALGLLAAALYRAGTGADFGTSAHSDNKLLGLPEENLDEAVGSILKA